MCWDVAASVPASSVCRDQKQGYAELKPKLNWTVSDALKLNNQSGCLLLASLAIYTTCTLQWSGVKLADQKLADHTHTHPAVQATKEEVRVFVALR